MKKLLTVIFVITFAVFLALFLKQAPGYVLLSYKNWVVELSLWTSVIMVMLGFLFLHKFILFIKYVIHIPSNTSHWLFKRKQQKIFNNTSKGLLKLAEGNFQEALNLLSQSAKAQKKPLINYLTAAKAAQEVEDIHKRDEFLRLAFECSPKSGLSIGLMQANLQFDNHEYEAALATLKNLMQKYGNNKVVLRRLLSTYIQLKDWYSVMELAPELLRYRVFSKREILDYEIQAAINYFKLYASNKNKIDYHNFAELEQLVDSDYNKKLSKQARSHYEVISAYIHCQLEIFKLNKNSLTQDIYSSLINKLLYIIQKATYSYQKEAELKVLFELYGDIAYQEQHFKAFEKELKKHEYNVDLLINLGKLAIKLEDFEKAYQYLNQAQKLSSDNTRVKYYLAFVLLKLDKKQQSFELFNQCFHIT